MKDIKVEIEIIDLHNQRFLRIDLILLFKLTSRVPNATLPLRDIVENHIYEKGLDAIERIHEVGLNVNSNIIPSDL